MDEGDVICIGNDDSRCCYPNASIKVPCVFTRRLKSEAKYSRLSRCGVMVATIQ